MPTAVPKSQENSSQAAEGSTALKKGGASVGIWLRVPSLSNMAMEKAGANDIFVGHLKGMLHAGDMRWLGFFAQSSVKRRFIL